MIALCSIAMGAMQTNVMHGSGTTNPSKLFWQAMDTIEERARMPLHLTYRAVGSSTGQKEFVGDNGSTGLNNFGSGDIPMTSSRYAEVTSAGREMLHVPFAMGAIGVFHSVPTSNLGGAALDLNGCLLAKIFSRQITMWDDAEIQAVNPSMTYTGEIKVVHRVQGSSSTAGFTEYLSGKCPASWTIGSGSTIIWPGDTSGAQGSGGMASFIAANVGAIGYIDAGHGHAAFLGEVKLQNRDGLYLDTKEADIGAAGTIALSATPSVIPFLPTSDFSAVNLYDLAGPTTWPITMISYFYLDKSMASYDPVTASLVKYFVEYILSEEGQALAEDNMFVKLPPQILSYNTNSIASITMPIGAPTFITETASITQPLVGAGEYVISGKRKSYAEVERTANSAAIAAMFADHDDITAAAARLTAVVPNDDGKWSANDAGSLAIVGLILGLVGLLLGGAALFTAMSKARTSKPRSVEINARDMVVPKDAV